MSHDGWVALPRGAMGLSAVSNCGIPDHAHLLFWMSGMAFVTKYLNSCCRACNEKIS